MPPSAPKLRPCSSCQHVGQGSSDPIATKSCQASSNDAADRIAGPDATADQKAKIDDFKKQAAQSIDAKLGWAAMKPDIVALYMKSFTQEQLDGITAFYKSPARRGIGGEKGGPERLSLAS